MNYSKFFFDRAQQIFPGGVNSPVRAFQGVGGEPILMQSGQGAYIMDVDHKKYIDYVGAFGPLILGHAHPFIIEQVIQILHKGTSFGATTEIEIQLAEKISELMPSIEMIRFVNSGTEATMSAIRLARGFTQRKKIIKFIGCYHGHVDSLLVASGSGALTLGQPNSAGIPLTCVQDTLLAEYNHIDQVEALFSQYSDEIAGVIVEPVAGNMNCVLPIEKFLSGLRLLCDQYHSLLIFDEVMTGFRVALGGAQAYYQVKPDITLLGKIIGGGFPVGAIGGRSDVMRCIAPLGPVYQAGTMSGHPVAMAAGLAQLQLLTQSDFYTRLSERTRQLLAGFIQCAKETQIPLQVQGIGGMFGIFFTAQTAIICEKQVQQNNIQLFKQFFHGMLQEGIYFAPSAFEASFMSGAHGETEIMQTLVAVEKIFKQLAYSLR